MAEDLEYWYVRDGDQVTGPFTRAELDVQRDRNALTWFHEVSQDRILWVSASTLPPIEARRGASRSRRKHRGPSIVIGIIASAALAGLSWTFWPGPNAEPVPVVSKPTTPVVVVTPAPPTPPPPLAHDIHSAEAELELSSAVGLVVCAHTYEFADGTKTELPKSTGTCFMISEKGYLLTNRHVIEDVPKFRDSDERKAAEKKLGVKIEPGVWVFFFTKPENKVVKRPATIVYQTNPQDVVDLAVLKIDIGSGPSPYYFRLAPKGSGNGLKAKEVYSLGFPAAARLPVSEEKDDAKLVKPGTKIEDLFKESDFDYVTEHGIVNVVRKENSKTGKAVEWILHGAKISHGNSGGPLITKDATVVGINTLVQRVAKDGITNYFALGMTQIREHLAKNLPEIREQIADPVADLKKEKPQENAL